MSVRRTIRSIYLCNWLGKCVDKVNWNGGATTKRASACKSREFARPGGTILGAQVGGGANASACTGGTILGAKAGGGTVARAYKGITGPRSVILGVLATVSLSQKVRV
jgi:hypothetical protein